MPSALAKYIDNNCLLHLRKAEVSINYNLAQIALINCNKIYYLLHIFLNLFHIAFALIPNLQRQYFTMQSHLYQFYAGFIPEPSRKLQDSKEYKSLQKQISY